MDRISFTAASRCAPAGSLLAAFSFLMSSDSRTVSRPVPDLESSRSLAVRLGIANPDGLILLELVEHQAGICAPGSASRPARVGQPTDFVSLVIEEEHACDRTGPVDGDAVHDTRMHPVLAGRGGLPRLGRCASSFPPWEAGSSAEWRALTTPSSALAAASEIAFVIWHSSCTTGEHDEPSSKEQCEVEEWSNAHRHPLGVCPRRGTHEL